MTELLTTNQVAAMLHAPVKSVEHWRHVGAGPRYARVGKRVLYRVSDVEEWLEQRFRDSSV